MNSTRSTLRILLGTCLAFTAGGAFAQQAATTTAPAPSATTAQAAAQAAAARAQVAAQAATEAAAAAQLAAREAAEAQAAAEAAPTSPAVAMPAAAPVAVETAVPMDPNALSGIEARAMTRTSKNLEVVEEITPFTMTEEDRALTMKVIDIIADDPKMKGHIAVSARNGVVQLSGSVKSVPMIYRAVELTHRLGDYQVNVDRLDKKTFF